MFVTITFVTPDMPVSRRERPAKPRLSREAIVAAALRIMREEGLDRVTMRRIASELDTGPASLYVYVANAAALHGAMFDELLTGLTRPERFTSRSWRAAVVDVLVDYTTILLAEPSLARSILVLRPSGPNYLALWDWLLGVLRTGGVAVRPAAWGVDLLLQHATATEHGTRRETAGAAGAAGDAGRDVEDLAAAIAGADPVAHPGLAWAGDELFSGAGPERLRWHLERILAGIASAD